MWKNWSCPEDKRTGLIPLFKEDSESQLRRARFSPRISIQSQDGRKIIEHGGAVFSPCRQWAISKLVDADRLWTGDLQTRLDGPYKHDYEQILNQVRKSTESTSRISTEKYGKCWPSTEKVCNLIRKVRKSTNRKSPPPVCLYYKYASIFIN